jgi:hypothetical protein
MLDSGCWQSIPASKFQSGGYFGGSEASNSLTDGISANSIRY